MDILAIISVIAPLGLAMWWMFRQQNLKLEEKFKSIDKQFASAEEASIRRFGYIEKLNEQRFDAIDRRFDSMERSMNQRFEAHNQRFNGLESTQQLALTCLLGTSQRTGTDVKPH